MYLMNSLDGEAEKSVKTVATNGYFYATALKVLKRDFGNPLVVSHLKFKKLFDQKQINVKDKLGLRSFHQQLRICISWLSSIGYDTPLTSYENFVKALSVLPIKYQSEYFKQTKDFNMLDGTINLKTLKQCLKKQLYMIFNLLANRNEKIKIINKKQIKHQKLPDGLSKSLNAISGSSTRNNKKRSKTFLTKKFTCWACKNDHELMFCNEFLSKDVSDHKQFVKALFQLLVKKTSCQRLYLRVYMSSRITW